MTVNEPKQFRVPGSGLVLHAREWNAEVPGLPVVLLHGIAGSGGNWEATVAANGQRRAIAFDARGHGASDWDPAEGYGADQHFADIASALEYMRIDRCLLAGFSMGGTVAILAAACLPERVAGVAIIDSYPHPAMSQGSRGVARWISTSDDAGRTFDPAISRQFRAMLAVGDARRLDLRSMWEAITCPVLIVRGEHSDVLATDTAEDMLAAQPLSRLVTIPGVGHGVPRYRARELGTALAEFARAVEV